MPNTKQAIKRVRVNAKKAARNVQIKSAVKTAVRRFNDTLSQGELEETGEKLKNAVKQIDKAVSKGVVHRNTAARKKSRLTKRLNKAQAVPAVETATAE